MPDDSWRPDWRFKNKYPAPKKTSRWQWAWEFLRRNGSYADAYSKFEANQLSNEEIDALCDYYSVVKLYDPATNYIPGTSTRPRFRTASAPKQLPCGNPNQQKLRYHLSQSLETLIEWTRKKLTTWHTRHVHDDCCGVPAASVIVACDKANPAEVIITYDVHAPLDTQITEAKLTIQALQKPVIKRLQFDRYQLYLRLLDGSHAKASTAAMIKRLYPKDNNSRQHNYPAKHRMAANLKEARKVSASAYIHLLSEKPFEEIKRFYPSLKWIR